MSAVLDIEDLRRWIGAEETGEELLSAAHTRRFHATLSLDGAVPGDGEAAPRLIHFSLCQPVAPTGALGEDGHPARGGFLPPVPLPRRMWAGSKMAFHGDLKVGDLVRRCSNIADVAVKEGRTGPLCFVRVDHRFTVEGVVRVEEQQIIVYRALGSAPSAPAGPPAPAGEVIVAVEPSPTLLFRYSALTFNGHRIHYDAPYATEVEGYPGLVVHGPLQASLLFHLAARVRSRAPDTFNFRSLSTLYDREEMLLNVAMSAHGGLSLWTARQGGPIAMQAEAQWR